MKISVIITGYNCEQFAKRCIDSVFKQTYTNYEILVWNDASTDNTANVLKEYGNTIRVAAPTKNNGALYGRWYLVNHAATGEVVVFVGLDDELPPTALQIIADAYTNNNVWLTYGAWQHPGGTVNEVREYSNEVFETKTFRRHAWLATALNTFRIDLIKMVPLVKLLDERGEFYDNCTDLAYTFPCLEMCQPHNVKAINQCTYIYHDNPKSTINRLGKAHKTKIRNALKQIKPCTTQLSIGANV